MDPMGISISIIELWFVHMYLVGALGELKETCLTPTSGIGQKQWQAISKMDAMILNLCMIATTSVPSEKSRV